MDSQSDRPLVGVIGAGSFGTALSSVLAYNCDILLYTRQERLCRTINLSNQHLGYTLDKQIKATSDLSSLVDQCEVIVPVIPSSNFRKLMKDMKNYLKPYHILIHATKGLDITDLYSDSLSLYTMSEVITQETAVVRQGFISGPNLATEILEKKPSAAVITSKYDEVIDIGLRLFSSPTFDTYASKDILGAEMAGALKNIVAIGTGAIRGLDMGKNAEAYFITEAWHELLSLIHFIIEEEPKALYGLAGIGDLIATATSPKSRNFQYGYNLVKDERIPRHEDDEDLVEGVTTVEVMSQYLKTKNFHSTLIETIYDLVQKKKSPKACIENFFKEMHSKG